MNAPTPTPPLSPEAQSHRHGKPGKPRVVSLLPSATEILCALGQGAGRGMLVGRSHECDHPAGLEGVPVLTAARTHDDGSAGASLAIDGQVRAAMNSQQSLYSLDEARLRALAPDVILTQDLCHVCSIDLAAVRRVAGTLNPEPTVVSSNPETFEAMLDDVLTIGSAVGLSDAADELVCSLRERMYTAGDYVNAFADGPNVAFLEWADPLFIGGHWTPQLIERAGGRHPLNATRPLREAGAGAGPIGTTLRIAGKSVRVPWEVLAASRPEIVIICPCGFSLERAMQDARRLAEHSWFRELPAFKNDRVVVVDGNQYFNRPGPRLVDAFEWLVGYLNDRPELIPAGFAWRRLEK